MVSASFAELPRNGSAPGYGRARVDELQDLLTSFDFDGPATVVPDVFRILQARLTLDFVFGN